MRKNKKKEVLECLDSLDMIKNRLNIMTYEERKEILPLCQEMAIQIGTVIEQEAGNDTEVIHILERYCEEIYQLYVKIDRSDSDSTYMGIERLLTEIRQKIMEIHIAPYEILFLPYKAAMWDSLESVYLAAVDSKDCHVTVMPIPYYNVNPQKQILSVEYEGKYFPENIPITDFREYDIKTIKPDAIFIHNPYDQYNYVTQVAEDYYSSELIKYTPRLIYIPYFVSSRNMAYSHNCLVPAVKNAWRTFVQSEEIQHYYQQYVINKERIVSLGSPKFDKVKNKENNLKQLPDVWVDVFSNKRVFLLNTHLDYIISRSTLVLEKLSLIFHFFHKHEKIAILWRPHPLSIEAAKSLSPDFLDEYLELIKEFKNLSIGIYDESPDIHRAIAISDAYIGSISSVISLYGVTGKPIFIIDSHINNIIDTERNLNHGELYTERDNEIKEKMKNIEDSFRYLYCESFIPLEYYIELVITGRDLCKLDRTLRFTSLQYGFEEDKSAGSRIWDYVYKDINN